jgi:hypothetical protein
MGNHYLPNSRSCVSKTTMDCTTAMWHRVGGRMFTWQDVKDLLSSPAQLVSMQHRGYVKPVGEAPGVYRNYNPKVWQMTAQAGELVAVLEARVQ